MQITVNDEYEVGISQRSRSIRNARIKSSDGRIDRLLGSKGPISGKFKTLVRSDYEGILENTFLANEIQTYKQTLRALNGSADPQSIALAQKLTSDPRQRTKAALLCPIWRHEQCLKTTSALTRYFFPEVTNELFFATIIFEYADNLHVLEETVHAFRAELQQVIRTFNSRKRGVVLSGSLEPDLRTHGEIVFGRDLGKATSQLKWDVADHGGWVLSGHFLGRATYKDEFEEIVHEAFPADGWRRVVFKKVKAEGGLLQNVMNTINYMNKASEDIFPKGATRGEKRRTNDRRFKEGQCAFLGPSLRDEPSRHDFDWNAAIRCWALFIDRMGVQMLYSVENVHAQKWQSQSEMQYYRVRDPDWTHGYHRIELHRGIGPYLSSVDPRIRHLVSKRRTRKLKFDEEWFEKTDRFWGVGQNEYVPNFY